ncbi:MAG: serine/threonine-protein kinase, partial [Polyangiaceae bacterium]
TSLSATRRPKLAASLRIALAVAEALAEAHRNGVLHLDLKPENVMIPRDGRVRVVDFGLAMTSLGAEGGKGGDRLDEDGAPMVWGTPRFMAPEQWSKAPLDGAADVWALGTILYELSTGRLPYGRLSTRAELYRAVCEDGPVPSVTKHADLPDELVALIHRCLDKDPKNRPAASDVAEALRELLFGNWTRPTDDEGPFRGLLPFTERHADLYFGRETEIAAFVERSRLVPVLPVVGPSGAGKSSFVRAGVFQRLREEEPWIFLKVQPGTRPFDALAARLHSVAQHAQTIPPPPSSLSAPPSFDGLTPVDHSDALRLADELRDAPRRLSVALRQLAEEHGRKVLLFVDQLEELFTLVEEDAVRRAFVRALCTAADDAQDPVRVVFCIRDDFLGRLATDLEVAQALAQITVIQ